MTNITPCIAVDAMGGDHGPSVVVRGAVAAARESGVQLLLVGRRPEIEIELEQLDTSGLSLEVVHAAQVAEMDDKPSDVLRRKEDASIQVACRLVAEGRAQGVVSAGNSGATVACGMFIMGRVDGVERPALAGILPTEKNPMILVDVGGNVDCKPHHLLQFGLMAEVLARDVLEVETPRVGLLSIGEEEGKGNHQVKEAFELLKMTRLNFVGNVEGRDLFTGDVDVVVCDGFVGNVVLKLAEGLGSSLARVLKSALTQGIVTRLGTMLAMNGLRRFATFVDYAEYGGALLLGLKGIALVGHGASNPKSITKAIEMAGTYVRKQTNDHLIKELTANEELTRFGRAAIKH